MNEMAYHSSNIYSTQKDPNLVNMKKREKNHIEYCCTLEEYRQCCANYDNRMKQTHLNQETSTYQSDSRPTLQNPRKQFESKQAD